MATFGERLRELRTENGLKQADVAAAIGVSLNTVSLWEKGTREPDTKNKKGEENFDPNEVYYKLAALFDVPLVYLVGVSDDRTWHVLSDEEAAAAADAEEKEILDHMLELYQDLSPEMQEVVKITLTTMWRTDQQRGKLRSQQEKEPFNA